MRSRQRLATTVGAGALIIATACSTAPERSWVEAPADWTPESELGALDALEPSEPPPSAAALPDLQSPDRSPTMESPLEPLEAAPGATAEPEAPPSRGLIASAGPVGLRLLLPTGQVVGELAPGMVVTQPTWSRDGMHLAATVTDPESGTYQVAILDVASGQVASVPARRPYFFYSWSHDSTRLAALGPSNRGGTALDVLGRDGNPTSETSLRSGSLYVAWEPEGTRLLLHAGPQLLLVPDPDLLDDYDELGSVGFGFQAGAWVPASDDILYVETGDGSGETEPTRLLRRSVASGEIADLGAVTGLIAMAVHPDGDRAALSFASVEGLSPDQQGATSEAAETAAVQLAQDPDWSGSVQVLDLATGQRLTALTQPGWWLEWSPGGERLLMASSTHHEAGRAQLAWHVWDGDTSIELTEFSPSVAFSSNYLPFADQYDETPRLWSPDGDAITFGATTTDGDVTAVVRLDGAGAMTSLGPSDVSFWSPLPDALKNPASQ